MSAAVAVFYAVRAMDTVRPIRWQTFPALKRNVLTRITSVPTPNPRVALVDGPGHLRP